MSRRGMVQHLNAQGRPICHYTNRPRWPTSTERRTGYLYRRAGVRNIYKRTFRCLLVESPSEFEFFSSEIRFAHRRRGPFRRQLRLGKLPVGRRIFYWVRLPLCLAPCTTTTRIREL